MNKLRLPHRIIMFPVGQTLNVVQVGDMLCLASGRYGILIALHQCRFGQQGAVLVCHDDSCWKKEAHIVYLDISHLADADVISRRSEL